MSSHSTLSSQMAIECRPLSRAELQPQAAPYSQLCQLWQRCPNARFYQHPDWLSSAIEQLEPQGLQTLWLHQGDTLVGWLWLMPRQWHGHRLPGCWSGASHSHWPLADWLLCPSITLTQALEALMQQSASLGLGGLTYLSAWRFCQPLGTLGERSITQAAGHSALFRLRQDTPPIPGKLRRNLKRLSKQAESSHQLTFVSHRGEAVQSVFEAWLALEQQGWKEDTAIAGSPHLAAFYRQLSERFSHDQRCAINALYFDDTLVAAQFCLKDTLGWNLLKIAYDEQHKALAPGLLLLQWFLHTEHQSAEVEAVSLVSSPAWAERWHPELQPVQHIHHFADTWLGSLLAKRLRSYLARSPHSYDNP